MASAIQMVFPMETEDLFVVWHGIPIALGYKYDLGVIIDDLVPLLESIQQETSGTWEAAFGSDTFTASWDVSWSADQLTVDATWVRAYLGGDFLNRNCRRLEIDRADFLSEWKTVLQRVHRAVQESRVKLEDNALYERSRRLEEHIPIVGKLYRF